MSILLAAPRTSRPNRFTLAAGFLRDRGYPGDVIRAAASDPAVLDPADAESVGRILGDCAPAPAVPVYSPDPAVEASISEARACLWPASDRYKSDMGALADRQDRLAVIMAEPLAPADPWDREYASALDWPADVDAEVWTTTEPEPTPEPAPSAFRPYEPTAAERLWWVSGGSVNVFALPPVCGGAPDARPVRLTSRRARTNVGSCYGDEDQFRNHGCV